MFGRKKAVSAPMPAEAPATPVAPVAPVAAEIPEAAEEEKVRIVTTEQAILNNQYYMIEMLEKILLAATEER